MTRPFPLKTLQHLAQQSSESAIRKLGLLNRSQQNAQSKLDMLLQYRRDYQQKLQQAEQDGMDLQELCNFRDFIYRLDDAIAQQRAAVSQARQSVQQGREELTDSRRRQQSFDTLEKRHLEAEKIQEARTEQKLQDEHSSRRNAFLDTGIKSEH